MATVTNSGKDFQVRNITVNANTDTAIDFDNRFITSVMIRCRTAVDLYLREDVNSADYFTIPSGSVLTLDCSNRRVPAFYIRSASGTPVVEVIGFIE